MGSVWFELVNGRGRKGRWGKGCLFVFGRIVVVVVV